jgi:hypothetical protein
MILQSIPTAANTIKAMLADQAAPSQQIDDLISRYLRVRDSSSIDKLEHELTAIFAGGVDHAADIVAGLESLPRIAMRAYHRNRERTSSPIPVHACVPRFGITAHDALPAELALP